MFTKTARKASTLAAAALCTATLFASPAAFAKDVKVSYADLDLSTVAGQQKLQTRLDSAARRACESHRTTTGTMLPDRDSRACLAQAKSKAREQMAAVLDHVDQDALLGG